MWSFAKWGLVVDAGGAYLLPRLVGLPRAKAMVMLGEGAQGAGGRRPRARLPVRADAEELAAAADELAARLAAGPDPLARPVEAAAQRVASRPTSRTSLDLEGALPVARRHVAPTSPRAWPRSRNGATPTSPAPRPRRLFRLRRSSTDAPDAHVRTVAATYGESAMGLFDGKVAIVTGAGRGIGRDGGAAARRARGPRSW